MKHSRACLLLLALLCAFFFLGCSAAKTEPEADTDPVVARYRDTELRQSLVDYEKKNLSALSGGKEVRDRDAVDQLLVNLIMSTQNLPRRRKTTRSSRRCAHISTNIASPPESRWRNTTLPYRNSCRV